MLGSQFQTVIYYEDTGDIREVLPNQYVKSRKHLNLFLNMPASIGLKFFYIEGGFPIDSNFYRVRLGDKREPPRLVCIDGTDPTLGFIRDRALFTIKNKDSILVKFEGGMGDYVDQADVVLQLKKENPEKKIYVEIQHPNRGAALELFKGWEGIQFFNSAGGAGRRMGVIEMDYISRVHGYSPGGKIGVYSKIGGLEETAPRAEIAISQTSAAAARTMIDSLTLVANYFLVILHTTSGPANSKSIPIGGAMDLLKPLLLDKKVLIAHVGGAGEEEVNHDRVINMQGRLGWEKVFALMRIADACLCIDSSIMHIAQHLRLPTLSLWGPTDPTDILGEDPGVDIIETKAHCRGCGLWNCTKGDCMTNFSKKAITAWFKKVRGGL